MEQVIALHGEYPNVEFDPDADGNQVGGVRSPYVDVPVATYYDDGRVEMFTEDQLDKRYGTPENYAAQVDECLKALVEARWLLLRGAEQISRQAHSFHWKK